MNWVSSAIARRPRNWVQVSDQPFVIRVLQNSISMGRISACYIFSGPSGVGKTTVARVFAAAMNCEQVNKPCGVCDICNSIQASRSEYVVEQDAASERGYQMVEDLKERISVLRPIDKKLVIVLDEAHMLSKEAFASLLKILEGGMENIHFILVTTDKHKIPDTILNRAMDLNFKAVSDAKVIEAIESVFRDSGLTSWGDVPRLIATQLAKGSVREALHAADQVVVYAENGVLDADGAVQLLGIATDEVYRVLANAILDKNPIFWVKDINSLFEKGYQPNELMQFLQRVARDLSVAVGTDGSVPSLSGLPLDKIKPHVIAALTAEELASLEAVIEHAMCGSGSDPRIVLELVFFDWLYGVKKAGTWT